MKVRLGKVMLTPKGVYSSSATYSRLDLVIKDDCAYVSLAEDNTGHPLTDENYWMLLLDGAFTRRYYEQNGITVASIICNGNATIGGNLTINGSIISPDLQAKINTLNSSINNNSSRINALTTRVTALENNSGGGSGGGGGSVDPAVIAQLRSEINAKVDITYFNRLFQAYNGTSPVFPNDGTTTINNIKALHDFWSAGSVTALGYNSGGSGGGGGGGVEYLSLLSDVSLTSPSEGQALVYDATLGKWKNGSVIPSGSFATESWVTTQLSNYYTKSQTEQKIADAISQSGSFDPTKYYLKTETYSRQEVDNALNGYLPTTGGTITGNLTVSGSKLHLGQYTSLENYNGAIFSLPSKGVNTSWTLATTSDIPDISTLVTKDYFRTLFTPIDAQGQVIAATDTTTPIASIRANYDFWSTGAVSAYGTSSSGGGQGVQLGALLTSLNSSGLAAPTSSEIGKTIVWTSTGWTYDTAGSGSGITLSDVRSDLQSTTPAYKINAVHIPDLSNTYLTPSAASATYAQKATTLAGYGITDAYTKTECDNKYVTIATQQTVTGEKTFNTYTYFKESIILDKQAQQYIQFNGGTNKVGFYGQGSDGSLYIYSQNPLNWYTDINGHVGLAVWGNGNVGVGALNPQYNLDVTGTIRATDSVIIGGGKIAWDSTNNSLYVQGADGSICHLYSLGGISALGVGTGSGASINSLRVSTINTDTLNVSDKIVANTISGGDTEWIDIVTPNDDYVEFNYQDDQDYLTYFKNVGLFGENNAGVETWRIGTDGLAEFDIVKATSVNSTYFYMSNLARLRANGATVYLETRTSTSASWEIKETWN